MKNNKLLASLKKAIQAAEMMMDSSTTPSMESDTQEEMSTTLLGGGTSKTVFIKKADFSKPYISMIEYQECPEGRCDPEEFLGRCCIFDPSAGWNCIGGLMSSECAQQGGIYEANTTCDSEPPCGASFTPQTSPLPDSPPEGQTSNRPRTQTM